MTESDNLALIDHSHICELFRYQGTCCGLFYLIRCCTTQQMQIVVPISTCLFLDENKTMELFIRKICSSHAMDLRDSL